MNDQFKARGWIWDKSLKPTQWVVYSCVRCNNINTFPTIESFSVGCKVCNSGMYFSLGYVRKVRQVKA